MSVNQYEPCTECKFQFFCTRESCALRIDRYFTLEQIREICAVKRIFGSIKARKIIRNFDTVDQQSEAAESLIWNALQWRKDPVLGPYGTYQSLVDKFNQLNQGNDGGNNNGAGNDPDRDGGDNNGAGNDRDRDGGDNNGAGKQDGGEKNGAGKQDGGEKNGAGNGGEKNGSGNTEVPCAACKDLNRECKRESCVFWRHFPQDRMDEFKAVRKVFGARKAEKLLKNVDVDQQSEVAESLIWEAMEWKKNLKHGPYRTHRRLIDEFNRQNPEKNSAGNDQKFDGGEKTAGAGNDQKNDGGEKSADAGSSKSEETTKPGKKRPFTDMILNNNNERIQRIRQNLSCC